LDGTWGGIFGTAITSVDFQMRGTNPSRIEASKIAQIQSKIAQETIWEAVSPRSFKYINASKAICNLHRINDEV